MKPDGVTMETTEPTEAAAIAEPSIPQDDITQTLASSQPEKASSDAVRKTEANANGKPAGAKPKPVTTKKQPTTKTDAASGSNSQPGTPSRRPVNDVKPSSNVASKTAPVRKQPAPSAKPSGAGAVPKKTVGFPSSNTSTSKNQTKLPDKKTAGPARTTSTVSAAATVTNGTKPTAVNGTLNKTAGATKPKMTAPIRRPTGSTVPKPGTSTSTKPDGAAPSKTTRAATAPIPRPAAKPMIATATAKPPTNAKTTVSRVTTAPSAGRTTAGQPNKATAPLKKDVSRPPSAAVAKKPTPTSISAAAKKPEVSKSASNTTSKLSTKSDAKLPSLKPQPTIKTNATKKPAVAAARIPAVNRTASSQSPLGSPACKSPATANTPRSKLGHKPTWAVSPFTAIKKREKTGASNATTTVASNNTAVTSGAEVTKTVAAVMQETQVETVALLQGSPIDAIAPEEDSGTSLAQSTPLEMVQQETVENRIASPPQSPARTALPQQHSVHSPTTQEDVSAPADSSFPLVASSPQPSEEKVYLITEHTSSTSKAQPVAENSSPQIVSPSNLNEEEEEEEKEGSQLVSISEMSGTTQPTEESRPGSAGPVGASAWRVGGALLSELDSEEVSVSQQGASELSAPGVLEGTESMDDLGDGSLKGAMDMEGASAGSPDFERVPDIPVNDYDEDDEDDNDRVCDMDVGSERTDEPQRHDNDVDDDEDVEMASEGVTESGLESYGNADEDDFAEDERLDNLNRVAQPPPPPPLLPSAPAAQWDQPNPFVDSWTELYQQHPSEHEPGQGAEAATASPLADPWKADSETPTQASTQAWLELGCTPCVPGNQKFTPHSSDKDQQQTLEPQVAIEEPSHAPHQTLCLAPLCAPGSFLSSTVSSGMSTPEELDDNGQGEKDVLALQLSPQPELDRGDEAGTLPSEKVIGGSATAPASNPSSSSVTEDEATDTEGEAQLEDSIEAPSSSPANVTFECQAYGQRCLSTVEEGEEIEGVDSGAAEDATPLSATSQVSYGFDSMTTASNSNAQSTGESCVKSPGIFSLEELPEEAKDPGLIQLPLAQPCPSEQQDIKCGMQEVDSAQASTDEMARSDIAFAPSPEPQEPAQIQPLDNIQPSYYSAQVSAEEMARSDIAFAPSPEPREPEQQPLDDIQPSYYSAICEKTENSFAGFTALLHPLRRDHSAYSRSYCDIVKPVNSALSTPKLTCADLPPRSPGQQSLSPQLRRLEQHQRHLQELQQRREQQSRPLEEAEQERKRREEEEQRRKKDEAEEEIKRNKEVEKHRLREQEEELKQRKDLELQLHQQQEELKQRQQIMQWQQELQQSTKGQTLLLSPSSGLCTIYETLENSEDEEAGREEKTITELKSIKELNRSRQEADSGCGRVTPEDTSQTTHGPPPPPDSQQTQSSLSQDGDSSPCHQESPDRPAPLELDWGKKVDIVHQLINQTLLLNGDGCSSLLLLPGGAGGTLSPLESSLWPSLLPPLTPPSATVTSVSSFSPETTGSSPQGEWTVVELETHH